MIIKIEIEKKKTENKFVWFFFYWMYKSFMGAWIGYDFVVLY